MALPDASLTSIIIISDQSESGCLKKFAYQYKVSGLYL